MFNSLHTPMDPRLLQLVASSNHTLLSLHLPNVDYRKEECLPILPIRHPLHDAYSNYHVNDTHKPKALT